MDHGCIIYSWARLMRSFSDVTVTVLLDTVLHIIIITVVPHVRPREKSHDERRRA